MEAEQARALVSDAAHFFELARDAKLLQHDFKKKAETFRDILSNEEQMEKMTAKEYLALCEKHQYETLRFEGDAENHGYKIKKVLGQMMHNSGLIPFGIHTREGDFNGEGIEKE